MAKGLDELIDWLVAETAYCGETGFRVADFVTAVSRFNSRAQPKAEAVEEDAGISSNNAPATPTAAGTPAATPAADVFVDMPLARKTWEWLVERPEILVGRNGDRSNLTLDEALALPEPQPPVPIDPAIEDAEDQKINIASSSVSSTPAGTPTRTPARTPVKDGTGRRKDRRAPKSMAAIAAEAAAAAANEDLTTRPRLYASEKTIWYTLTGHDVDYKKIPMLEWQCLQGIATARTRGILQADLRELVGQDKRSVPKRTDFLAAKGYAVKRTTIARGYRTSMLWLAEFAPIELDADPTSATESTETLTLQSSKELASNGIDLSPEFLRKDLAPVPWRNRWLGDALDFDSFGQTILAVVKAWGVIRVVDLKVKLGIVGMRWQMRTLARASREFVASGILKYVAAMRADERQLFKDCIKYERDPTPGEWAVYLAAGRRRAPLTELRAKRKKEQDRLSYGGGADNQSEMGLLEDEDEDELTGVGGSLLGSNVIALSKPAWALDVPLANLIYDTIDRAGIDGITSPEICRATLGPSFSRYIFSLVTAMSRPGNQPDHLIKFQLHCEPSRVGKNKAYLFRTLENAKLAERIANGESVDDVEKEVADAAAATEGSTDAEKFWELREAGKLADLPAEELRRLYGFAPLPPPMTEEELAEQEAKFSAPYVRKKPGRTGRPRKYPLNDTVVEGNGTPGADASTPQPKKRRGRPPKIREVELEADAEVEVADTEMADVDAQGNAENAENAENVEDDVEEPPEPVTPKRRGRPPKVKEGEEDRLTKAPEPKPSPPKRGRGRPPKKGFRRRQVEEADDNEAAEEVKDADETQAPEAEAEEEDTAPKPPVRLGEANSLDPWTRERRGRRRRSIVVIFHFRQLRDRTFLANQQGYKEGAIRIEPNGSDEDGEVEAEIEVEADADESGRSDQEDNNDNEENDPANDQDQNEKERSESSLAEIQSLAVGLEPVACQYNGKQGHLTVDIDTKTLSCTLAIPRRGRRPAHPKEPITITTDDLVGDPVIRRAPGGDGQAFVLEAKETSESKPVENDDDQEETPQESSDTTWPFVFILDEEVENNDKHAITLRDILVALRTPSQPQQEPQEDKAADDATPVRKGGHQPGTKNKKPGKPGKPVEAGPNKFVCETCNGVWKNLLGLQYHQTKARTACNPNYVPISAADKEAQKKQQREEREKERRQAQQERKEQQQQQHAEQAEPGQGGRIVRGRALRERKQPVGTFRETSPLSQASTRSHSPSHSEASDSSDASVPRQKKEGRHKTTTKVHGNRRRPYRLQESDSSDEDREDHPRGITGARLVWSDSREESPEDVHMSDGPSNVPAPDNQDTTMGSTVHLGAIGIASISGDGPPGPTKANLKNGNTQRSASASIAAETSQHVALLTNDATPPPGASTTSTSSTPALLRAVNNLSDHARQTDSSDNTGVDGFKMPPLPKNGTKLTPSSLRSYIVMEIIQYLLNSYECIFPSDRSLWYAVFHIYTRKFPGEDPPSLTVIKAAVKKLEMSKEVEEHTFGFRDPRGQFIYCRLLARPGTNLVNSVTAEKFKTRIRQAYPQPYVPDEFTPTDKDMAILNILDKHTGRNSRGRRPLQPEIEVLNAPFYEQPQAARPTSNAVLVVGYDDAEDGDNNDDSNQQGQGTGTPGRKRKSMLTAGDIIGGTSAEQSPKRRKTKYTGPATENSLLKALGHHQDGEGVDEDDNEADIDPALRTVKVRPQAKASANSNTFGVTGSPLAAPSTNPGLDSLPASFFSPEDDFYLNWDKTKSTYIRDKGTDDTTTFIHFLTPNTLLEDGQDGGRDTVDYASVGKHFVSGPASQLPKPRAYKMVTKTHTLYDLRKKSPGSWPILTDTFFERQSDASFTIDGFMPTRKALIRANLPRSANECASMLRSNYKLPEFDDTPEGIFNRDLEHCRSWEMSQDGADLLRNPSVAPHYVFLNLAFPGEHLTAEDVEAQTAGKEKAYKFAHPPLRWMAKNLYTVNTIPYGLLDGEEAHPSTLAPNTTPSQRKKWARSTSELAALREKQARQAKYGMSSRRELTGYPQKPADYIQHLSASASAAAGGMDWTANDTLVAAFIVVRTLLGGLSQTIDWGLMMRLFPDKRLSALRNFWKNTRKERQAHIDKFTERFQQAFIEAYEQQTIPPLDYENVLAYNWGWLVGWALRLMRHDANALPATREDLDKSHTLVDLPQSRTAGWREEFFHATRSVWNRLHDTASEPAATAIDRLGPATPTEAEAEGAVDKLRYMVARSWIRALCGTPHARYQPSRIKRKLLTLGTLGARIHSKNDTIEGTLDEASTNALLQTVIGNLTTDRILRRTKSLIALGGRMYTLTEAYESTLEKSAVEEKYRQAFAFKTELDACFHGRRGNSKAYEIPVDTNDDGMVMALMNLQAHGRVVVESIDAPVIPFGFEPGNYESRKFPKHYQRFRTRIVPTDKYVYNDDPELAAMMLHVAGSVAADGGVDPNEADNQVLPPPPRVGPNEEMPIWRDFFGVLDRKWFAKLAGAVVFLLATRGAMPIRQTAAHLRPIIEPFEVQMLMDWGVEAGILSEGNTNGDDNNMNGEQTVDNPPNSQTVSEWWWLLVGQVYVASDVTVHIPNDTSVSVNPETNGDTNLQQMMLSDIEEEGETRERRVGEYDAAMEEDDEGDDE
ncbi:hypothetical protein Sste5346_005328 [Sporothrix stenoceras]|uniref:TFIIIC transcription initiation factor complex subunits Tfc3 n=1 Tax=Sporothrix stenoceras TaxID=5173 RepID=A0ABR3Z5U8_9PEZI